jgi:antitoxin component YwqK of YwqJK toxin-antitoxin module
MKTNLILVIIFLTGLINAQETINYPHCDCKEKINCLDDNSEILNGSYELICEEKLIEKGEYLNGNKDGKWITMTKKGTIVSSIDYDNGVLNGDFLLYHYTGKPKLVAKFEKGLKVGDWKFFNAKGKLIKQGSYQSGQPIGLWSIYDKKGKVIISQYDYSSMAGNKTKTSLTYYKNNTVLRDDQSGGYFILYYPDRNVNSETYPLGGYDLAGDYFAGFLNIPTILADTYTNYNFLATLKIENRVVSNVTVEYKDRHPHNSQSPTFPILVRTDSDKNLTRVEHNQRNIRFLQERIFEIANIIGPWIMGSDTSQEIKIYIPYVLNDLRKQ